MSITILILFVLAAYHFIYESIIAPSERSKIRYDLFKLRDRLVKLKIEKGDEISHGVFKEVEHSVNSSIRNLPITSISLLFSTSREFIENKKLDKHVSNKLRKIESCNVEEVKEIYDDAMMLSVKGFLWNSGGWLPYFLPFILIALIFDSIKYLNNKIKSNVAKLSFVTDHQLRDLGVSMT